MPENEYADFVEEKPSNEAFAALHTAVREAKQKQKEIVELNEKLHSAQAYYNGIVYGSLPTMMAAMKLSEFKTEDGLDIKLKEEVGASISEDNQAEAFAWLEANGHGGIIKREVSVAFSKGQEEQAKALLELLADKYPNLSNHKNIHPMTLKAWATEMLKKGAALSEKITIRQVKVAKLPNEKK